MASWLRTKVSIPATTTSFGELGGSGLDHAVQQLEFPLGAGRVVLELAEDAVEDADVVETLADRFARDVRILLRDHRHHHHGRVVRVRGERVWQAVVARFVTL